MSRKLVPQCPSFFTLKFRGKYIVSALTFAHALNDRSLVQIRQISCCGAFDAFAECLTLLTVYLAIYKQIPDYFLLPDVESFIGQAANKFL